jgi:hypothetical protein
VLEANNTLLRFICLFKVLLCRLDNIEVATMREFTFQINSFTAIAIFLTAVNAYN